MMCQFGGSAPAQAAGQSPGEQRQLFLTRELLEPVKDRTWLAKVINALNLGLTPRPPTSRPSLQEKEQSFMRCYFSVACPTYPVMVGGLSCRRGRPAGAGFDFGLGFYNDVAPMALGDLTGWFYFVVKNRSSS
jgi:hypothetical protein